MTTSEARRLCLLLALLVIGLPWTAGGRTPLGIVALLLAVGAGAAISLRGAGEWPARIPGLAIAAGIWLGLSAVHTIYPDRTIQSLLLLAAYLLAGALAQRLVRKSPPLEAWLLAAILFAGMAVAAAGSLSWLQGGEGGLYASVLVGPFGYPNAAAGFLLLSGGAGLALAAGMPGGRWRWPILALLAIPAGGILLTRSRGALLAWLVGGVAWAALAYPRWREKRRVWLSLAGLAGTGILAGTASRWLPPFTAMWTTGVWTFADSSLQWRWQILAWTWQMIRDHPWLGVGPGAFPVALLTYQSLPYAGGVNPHNVYVELAAEFGLPAAGLLVLGFVGLLARLGALTLRLPSPSTYGPRLEAILATLIALAFHAALDLLWMVPVIPACGAILAGIAASRLPVARRRHPPHVAWRAVCAVTLLLLAGLALSRYSASRFLEVGRAALAAGDLVAASGDLTWALRLNPVGYAAHEMLTRSLLASGATGEAVGIARRAVRLAPTDPNSRYLAGAALLAAGKPDAAAEQFLAAVERAPATQLRFHAGLVEALIQEKRSTEARWRYAQTLERFSPARVTADEARCLAPGDRYLLARLSRIIAPLYREAGLAALAEQTDAEGARLAVPDERGICTDQGRPANRSPELALIHFWRTVGDRERSAAGQSPSRKPDPALQGGPSQMGPGGTRTVRVARIEGLTGGEREVTVEYEAVFGEGEADGRRCATSVLQFTREGWVVAAPPRISSKPCAP